VGKGALLDCPRGQNRPRAHSPAKTGVNALMAHAATVRKRFCPPYNSSSQNFFAKKMDRRVISAFTRVFNALCPAMTDNAQRELVRLGKKVMRSGKTANSPMPATMIHTNGQEAR
jgi:hypothetical protein